MSITSAEPTSPLVIDDAQLIGGRWVGACGGQTIDVINPATGQVLGRVPRGDSADVDLAVAAAQRAIPAWRDTEATARGALLSRWADLIDTNAAEIGRLECLEVGHPPWGPPPMARILRFIAGQADKVSGLSLPTYSPDVLGLTLREPYGVVGSVIPWNAPGPMFVTDVGPAITAGNTIVIKPAEDAPTLFDQVDLGMRIAQEEIFGPVLSVMPVDGEDEAVAVANGTEYGLVASVWTGDVGRAVRMSRKLAAGQVVVNAALGAGVIGGPFGGYKHSGFGRTMGADAVLDYTQVKTVSIRGTKNAAASGPA